MFAKYNKLPKFAAKARLGQILTGLRPTTFTFALPYSLLMLVTGKWVRKLVSF
ncbi:MAG: hypothetical protein ACI9LX_004470 [Paraglaciecola sp.]|jgi:hypothetical protein